MKHRTPLWILLAVVCLMAVLARQVLPPRPTQRHADISWVECLDPSVVNNKFPHGIYFSAHLSHIDAPVAELSARVFGPGLPTERQDIHLDYSAFLSLLDGLASHGLWNFKRQSCASGPGREVELQPGACWINVCDDGGVIVPMDDPAYQALFRYVQEQTPIGTMRRDLLQKIARPAAAPGTPAHHTGGRP